MHVRRRDTRSARRHAANSTPEKILPRYRLYTRPACSLVAFVSFFPNVENGTAPRRGYTVPFSFFSFFYFSSFFLSLLPSPPHPLPSLSRRAEQSAPFIRARSRVPEFRAAATPRKRVESCRESAHAFDDFRNDASCQIATLRQPDEAEYRGQPAVVVSASGFVSIVIVFFLLCSSASFFENCWNVLQVLHPCWNRMLN